MSTETAYAAPKFEYQHIREELEAVTRAAGDLLARNATGIVDECLAALEGSRKKKGLFAWQISQHRPIVTNKCNGGHHPSSKGPYDAEGVFTFKWEIEALNPTKNNAAKFFQVKGNITTKIELRGKLKAANGVDASLGSLRFEIGDQNAPGPFFHGQVDWPNHSRLDVPRLPSILLTPAECLDFLLGELFQGEWPKRQQAHKAELQRWSVRQKNRICNLLDANKAAVKGAAGISPWITLKNWKPTNADFLVKG